MPMRDRIKKEIRRFLTPHFLIAAAVLLVAGVSLQYVVHSFKMFLSKEPLPLRQELYRLADRFGPFELANQEPDLDADIEAVLGAHAYITREYRDTRLENPNENLIRLHVAYFTGTPDTVIHVPEICYVSSGAEGQEFQHTDLNLNFAEGQTASEQPLIVPNSSGEEVRIPSSNVPVRVFDFIPRNGRESQTVVYFFAANGRFLGTPEHVRTLAFDIRDRYAYWCKIEVLPMGAHDREAAMNIVREFLSYALPEVMTCLPDWHEVKAGNYPPDEETTLTQKTSKSSPQPSREG